MRAPPAAINIAPDLTITLSLKRGESVLDNLPVLSLAVRRLKLCISE